MKLQELLNDDDAVSPVIGVILMVAITVILAAVIATFVLGLGSNLSNQAPQASFSFDYTEGTDDELTVTHDGGETIEASALNATVSGAVNNGGGTDAIFGAGSNSGDGNLFTGSDVAAGRTDKINGDDFHDSSDNPITNVDLSGATVRVVYSSENGESSAVLAEWSGPDA